MHRFLGLILTLLTLQAGTAYAQAQDCGPADAPCQIEGGFYHAALPDGPARGAVVFLHGYGGRAAGVVSNAGLMNAITSRGYAVIAVQGRPRFEGDRGGSWNSMAVGGTRRDDVGFIAAAVEHASQSFDFDRENVILSGFSGGGMMTWRVACDAPGDFAAYAPIAGTFWEPVPTDCTTPVRIFHTHGTTDTVVPLAGRTVGSGLTQGNVFEVLANQRALHGCGPEPSTRSMAQGRYEISEWSQCSGDDDIVLALHDGGHTIPRGWSSMVLDWFENLP